MHHLHAEQEEGSEKLLALDEKWSGKYPVPLQDWGTLSTFLQYDAAIYKMFMQSIS